MRGKRVIKTIDKKLLEEISQDYRHLILKKRIKKGLFTIGQVSAEVLLIAGIFAGVMTLAVVAPNVVGAIGKLIKQKKIKPYYFHCDQKQLNKTLAYLKNRHLIEVVYKKDGASVKLTPQGKRRYRIHLIENMVIKKIKKWDGWWHIVIFDIPERFKIAREAIRQKLQNLGFYQIQKSVFVIPYPCEKEINFIRHLFGLENQIRLIKASYFQGEEEVKKYIRLSD